MQDPLSFPAITTAGVETSLPLIPEGDYLFQISESNAAPNKKQTGLNWNLKLMLAEPTVAIDGREVTTNFAVFMTVALQPAEDAKDPEGYKRGIADAVDAIFGTDKSNRPDLTPALVGEATGKMVRGHIYIDEYPQGSGNKNNKVKRLKKATA